MFGVCVRKLLESKQVHVNSETWRQRTFASDVLPLLNFEFGKMWVELADVNLLIFAEKSRFLRQFLVKEIVRVRKSWKVFFCLTFLIKFDCVLWRKLHYKSTRCTCQNEEWVSSESKMFASIQAHSQICAHTREKMILGLFSGRKSRVKCADSWTLGNKRWGRKPIDNYECERAILHHLVSIFARFMSIMWRDSVASWNGFKVSRRKQVLSTARVLQTLELFWKFSAISIICSTLIKNALKRRSSLKSQLISVGRRRRG